MQIIIQRNSEIVYTVNKKNLTINNIVIRMDVITLQVREITVTF
jgi:hypothetical protein